MSSSPARYLRSSNMSRRVSQALPCPTATDWQFAFLLKKHGDFFALATMKRIQPIALRKRFDLFS